MGCSFIVRIPFTRLSTHVSNTKNTNTGEVCTVWTNDGNQGLWMMSIMSPTCAPVQLCLEGKMLEFRQHFTYYASKVIVFM